MAYIKRRTWRSGKTSYIVRFKDQDGKWVERSGGSRRKDAETLLRRLQEEVAAGTFGKRIENPTVEQFFNRYMEAKKASLKPSTWTSYEVAFRRHILPILGKKRLRDLRPVDIQAWVDEISQNGLSPATVGRCYRYLRACVRQAEAWEIIDHNPFKGIILPRVPRKELDFLNADEIRCLLDAAKFPEKALFAILALSGLRLGEALGLQWKDIDYGMHAIYVTKAFSYWGGIQEPKTESSRRAVTLLPVLADILMDYAAFLGNTNPDDFLFQTRGLRPLDPANARKRFEATLARAGLKRVTLHSLRHSYASLMLSSGANIKALSHALGHASVTMTLNTYSHLIEEKMEEAVTRMDALFRGVEEGKIVALRGRKKGKIEKE